MNIQVGDMLRMLNGSICVVTRIFPFSAKSVTYSVHWLKTKTSDPDDIEDIIEPEYLSSYEKRAIELYFERLS